MTRRAHQKIGILLIVIGICAAILLPDAAGAARIFPTITPNCDQKIDAVTKTINPEDRCDFTDFIQLFVNLFDWGLAILSILSVTFFIIGGAVLLLSGGNTDRVRTGASILKNTLFGILVALGSWLIVNSIIGILVGSKTFEDVRVFGSNWWGVSSCSETYNRECSQYSLERDCGDISTNYISELQRLLLDAGCSQISTDGCFGPQTESAVAAFNNANEIDDGGTATRQTWDALRAGKKCSGATSVTQIEAGTGCCVPQCGTGIEDTSKIGCETTYGTTSLWYEKICVGGTNDGYACTAAGDCPNGGSCNSTTTCSSTAVTQASGCCVLIDSTQGCVQDTTRFWCNNSRGVFNEGKTCDHPYLACGSNITVCQ